MPTCPHAELCPFLFHASCSMTFLPRAGSTSSEDPWVYMSCSTGLEGFIGLGRSDLDPWLLPRVQTQIAKAETRRSRESREATSGLGAELRGMTSRRWRIVCGADLAFTEALAGSSDSGTAFASFSLVLC